jgi:AcrR family transcriptional regulator
LRNLQARPITGVERMSEETTMTATSTAKSETRSERRKRLNRDALIKAGYETIAEKGIDAATMSEIADRADVGAGTAYNYFTSKDDLVMAVMEEAMDQLAQRIETVTNTFADPAEVYAFGIRTTIKAATTDLRWRWLLRRSEVIADAMFRVIGPYAVRDLRLAAAAGRFHFQDAELVYRLTTHVIVGYCLAVCDGKIYKSMTDETIVLLLNMAGLSRAEARDITQRPSASVEIDTH